MSPYFLLSLSLQSIGADGGDGANENRDDGEKEEVENEKILYHLLNNGYFFTLTKKRVVGRLISGNVKMLKWEFY